MEKHRNFMQLVQETWIVKCGIRNQLPMSLTAVFFTANA